MKQILNLLCFFIRDLKLSANDVDCKLIYLCSCATQSCLLIEGVLMWQIAEY